MYLQAKYIQFPAFWWQYQFSIHCTCWLGLFTFSCLTVCKVVWFSILESLRFIASMTGTVRNGWHCKNIHSMSSAEQRTGIQLHIVMRRMESSSSLVTRMCKSFFFLLLLQIQVKSTYIATTNHHFCSQYIQESTLNCSLY